MLTDNASLTAFQAEILAGIPQELPEYPKMDPSISRAPKRKDILSLEEKKLALKNALRYFPPHLHAQLAPEFMQELKDYGRIYMHRYQPKQAIYARPIEEYPHQSKQAAAIMLMIQNNLDPAVAQHPYELITYGGNGAVFQNWAQYRLTMKYLAEMTDEQTLVMYSGHPMGLFPAPKESPRVVVTNGMMIPNHSKGDDWERYNALGVTQYGQMTAGSYMYIGPQGIVHGTTITVLNAGRLQGSDDLGGKLFVTAGLGGMSGAQAKAAVIAGAIGVVAEADPIATQKRHEQGWVDEVYTDLAKLVERIKSARAKKEAVSLAYQGNVVALWEYLVEKNVNVELGSDQTSLHNPYAGGYYPIDMDFDTAKQMMGEQPEQFAQAVQATLRRHVAAINTMSERGMYFFDYGNAFLKAARDEAGADICLPDGRFKYPSYVQDIMGPMCFDFGFGPFRWVCASGKMEDLQFSDQLAAQVLEEMAQDAPEEISQQLADNIRWIKAAEENQLVVGSKARILYADALGRIRIAQAFNQAIAEGKMGPVVLGRDHHDVSGTDSPYRETSNIYDGSAFTADMAVQNFVGDAFRGATWISLHNGGGVGWGEVINGGFGMLLDGSPEADRRLQQMLFWDVNNGIARRAWARNPHARFAIEQEMKRSPGLQVTLAQEADEDLLDQLFK
ncbi:urocanate hydratase [Saprospira grandis]|uniref:Urocanate hydratase n=1 Tax=Saprospira grandis (strain Lewin) TaxID=984262 RepID=H6LAD4_SAPGL|nr:urocanate hydratase [Saprospira grandis]AFC24419.1 urocanate hydratase [Saprospira grandis str. Lewin]